MAKSDPKVLVALDFSSEAEVLDFVASLSMDSCRLKVGKELFTTAGPQLVERLQKLGFDVFLDLKFHDIPNTCAKAVAAAAELGVWMVNVHASGGRRMMEAAREAVDKASHKPLLIGVTVLTSMELEDLREVGVDVASPLDQVLRLARLSRDCGLDGVVCSAQEAPMLRQDLGNDFCLVTPGIRPVGADKGDQRRVVTPSEAMSLGSDYLVIGRPITQNPNPATVLESINCELSHTSV